VYADCVNLSALLRCARDTAAWCEEPTFTCGRIRSIVSGLLFTMKTATGTCEPSARDAMRRRGTRHCRGPLPFTFPRKRESRAKRSSFGILGPRFRGDERMLHATGLALRARLRLRHERAPADEGGAYFAGLGFELRSGAPPGLNAKLPSSSSAA
jgi:hypothetical protein